MGAKLGLALKTLQWFNRGVQFLCCGLILGVYSYFLATLASNNVGVPTWVRAVEGISGIGALYSGLALLLLCCLAGRKFAAFLAIVIDVAFAGAFIYVAVQNRAGASSCTEGVINTPFGSSTDSNAPITESGGPNFLTVCKLQSACLAVSIVAIFFFLFSATTEVFLARHRHKENRFGPGPANDYTSGYGKRKGILGFLKRSGTTKSRKDLDDPNMLPVHATPADMREPVDPNDPAAAAGSASRVSYATEATAVGEPGVTHLASGGDMGGYRNKYGDTPALDDPAAMHNGPPHQLPNNPYDRAGYGTGSNTYLNGGAGAGNSPYVNNTYPQHAMVEPGRNNFSRPRTAENGRAGPTGRDYRYSDGVYDV